MLRSSVGAGGWVAQALIRASRVMAAVVRKTWAGVRFMSLLVSVSGGHRCQRLRPRERLEVEAGAKQSDSTVGWLPWIKGTASALGQSSLASRAWGQSIQNHSRDSGHWLGWGLNGRALAISAQIGSAVAEPVTPAGALSSRPVQTTPSHWRV